MSVLPKLSAEGDGRVEEAVLAVTGLKIVRENSAVVAPVVSSIDVTVGRGEAVAIVGESGSGKSLTARALMGLLPADFRASGVAQYGGRNLLELSERELRPVRGADIALVMQDPFTILNPVQRCGRTIEETLELSRPGIRGRDAWRREILRRLAEVGITDETVADRYPFQLSGGMRQRVAIAAALARDPAVLIADEPTTALDASTQREVLGLLSAMQRSRGMSLILITHDLRVAFSLCDRIYVLYAGVVVEAGTAADVEREPLHPYTHGLLLSEPTAEQRVSKLAAIPGSVPAPDELVDVCRFEPRCRWAHDLCRQSAPPLLAVEGERLSACVRVHEIRDEMGAVRRQFESGGAQYQATRPRAKVLSAHRISKVFEGRRGEVHACKDVSVEVGEGEAVGIVGESGSGKTTLARILVGLEHASSGHLSVGDVAIDDWKRLTSAELSVIRRTVQTVFQDPYSSLNPMKTIGSTLADAIRVRDKAVKSPRREVGGLLDLVGLPAGYAARKPNALSGGERQRVAVARALAVRPKVLICDEPVSALDVSVQAQILNLLTDIRREQGIGYLFVTHDLSIVRQVVDYVYVMYQGSVVEQGDVDSVLGNPQHPYTVRLIQSAPRADPDWLGEAVSAAKQQAQ